MDKPKLTRDRIILAYVVAVVADAIDILISGGEDATAAFTAGLVFIPGEAASAGLDAVVGGTMWKLLGFHWAFLPSFLVELVPEVDMFPSWIACVAYVVWQRKKEEAGEAGEKQIKPQGLLPVVDVHSDEHPGARVNTPPLIAPIVATRKTPPLLSPTETQAQPVEGAVEKRLRNLKDLLDRNIISHAEYDAKRQQILSEI